MNKINIFLTILRVTAASIREKKRLRRICIFLYFVVYVETLLDCGVYRVNSPPAVSHTGGHKEMSSILADQWRPRI